MRFCWIQRTVVQIQIHTGSAGHLTLPIWQLYSGMTANRLKQVHRKRQTVRVCLKQNCILWKFKGSFALSGVQR